MLLGYNAGSSAQWPDVKHRLRNLPEILRTPGGRLLLLAELKVALWPLLHRTASAYRRHALSRTRVVAVVGSFGKTTTARAVTAALGLKESPRLEANASSGVAINLLFVWPGSAHAVLEIGVSQTGQMLPYATMVRPDITVVTSIGSEHHRSFGSLERTREEKSVMVSALPATGVAVLNGDDANVRWMAGATKARIMTFGTGPECDVRATEIALDWPYGTRFRLEYQGRSRAVRTRLLGKHQVHPILAAVAVGLAEGLDIEQTLPALERLPPTQGRLQLVEIGNGVRLLRDDYKSAIETIELALDVLGEIPAKRRLVVLGQVTEPQGPQGPLYRGLGARVGKIATAMVVVGGCFQRYATGAATAGMPRAAIVDAGHDVVAAAAAVRTMLQPGDVVLVKGRSTQRLERVALALAGRPIRCTIPECSFKMIRCDNCRMLERGWQGRRIMAAR